MLTAALPSPASLAACQDDVQASLEEQIAEYLAPYLEMGDFSGVIMVAKGDEVLFLQGYGFADYEKQIPNKPETKFLIGSLWKQFVAAAILKLHEEGKVGLDDHVSKYLPDYSEGERMTVHQLLCHTSGLPFDFTPASGKGPASFKDRLDKEPLLFAPGTQYNYSNLGYQLLYLIIYVVSGENPDDHMRRVIFEPLGMKDTGVTQGQAIEGLSKGYTLEYRGLQDTAKYVPWQAGMGYCTASDLVLWVRGLLGGKLICADSLKRMLTPNLNRYGYGWFIDNSGDGTVIFHAGRTPGHSCMLTHLIERQITIVVLGNIGNFPRTRISNDLLAIVTGEPYVIPKAYAQQVIDRRLLGGFTGVYEAEDGTRITVYSAGDHLFFTQSSADFSGDSSSLPRFVMFPLSDNGFFCKEIDCQLEFGMDVQGGVRSLKVTFNGELLELRRKD
jgi:CubicO group peptidase (beta-lactamase class C family)